VNLKISNLKMIAEKEVEILAKLQNDYVVRYKTSWIENLGNKSIFFIQMELCDRNLKDLLMDINTDSKLKTENRLSLMGYYLCSEITTEIFEAFKYLHEQKIIHLCAKPSNILIKNVKFGKVIRISGFSSSFKFLLRNELKIKSEYMAPEVTKDNVYDTKADIFSLGLCLSQIFDIEENEYKNKFIDNIGFDSVRIHKKKFLFSENIKRIKHNQSS
jgi:mitosis inhibitor protein kinase SWE1